MAKIHHPPFNDDNFNFLEDRIDVAFKNAQKNLLEKGIGYIYSRDNMLIEHHPDNSETIIQCNVRFR